MIYILVLNPMHGQAEAIEPVAVSHDRQALVDWLDGERHRDAAGAFKNWTEVRPRGVDTFAGVRTVDYTWNYSFREGSPIQGYNVPGMPAKAAGTMGMTIDQDGERYAPDLFRAGIHEEPDREEAAERARQNWDGLIAGLVTVPEGSTI